MAETISIDITPATLKKYSHICDKPTTMIRRTLQSLHTYTLADVRRKKRIGKVTPQAETRRMERRGK